MKSALQDDIAQEPIIPSGLLPLDIDQQEQFLTGVDLLAELTANLDSSTLHFPQLQNLKLNLDKTEAVETGIKWINSSLITIIDTASSSESNNVLSQLIHLFQESKQIISNDISSHLITILNCNNYPLLKQDICTILIDSEHPLNQLQSTNLTKLLNTEDSLCILDLLINKDLITAQTTQDFINVINKSTINSSEHILHKTYLLQIIDSFNEHPNLSTILSPQILDLFKTHHDIAFLKQIQKIIKDPSFFTPIYEEIHTKLQNFNRLLEIETIADGDLSEKDKESLKILLNLDNSYITKTAYASIFKLPDIKTLLAPNHTGYSKNDCAKLFLSVQKDLLQVLKYSNNLDDYLLNEYDQYCIKFSENPSIVHKGNYSKLLSNNIHACNQILFNRQTLSDECAKVLIDTLNDNISSSIDATQNASNIIFTLIKHNKLSPESSAKAINILKEMKAEDRFVSLNISKSFECLAKQNIIDDDFTQAVCTNHLHSSKIPTQILQGLEAILNYSGSIPNEATTAIVKFTQDIDNQTKLRLKAVNILCRTPLSIEEEDISNISSLLKGDFNHTIPLDTFNNNYDGELTLDYQKLDLYAHQNGLQITGRMQIGNAFFDSISEQISTFDKKKSAEDIYQTTKKELALFKNKYPSINIEEYDKAIGNGLLLDDSIIQATANALGVTINLYNYSGYVITKIPELKLDEKSIDIGITETRYWPLTANIETEYILSDDDLSTKASDSEERDYRVATATIKLLVDYAKIHNKLPQIAISALEETLSNELIVKDSISALIDILNHNPNIFKEDQLTQFKTLNSTISKQIEFSASLESLWSMLNNYNSHDSIDHQETDFKKNLLIELNHIFELLISTNQENIGNLYSIITKILQTEPELFVKCLQIIKLNPPTKHYIPEHQQVIDQLVIASDASYQDLCWLANNNCYSEKLQQSIAKYLDENINSIQTEESILATTIEAIKYLAINGDGLDTKSIHHLITLSQNIPQQTLNIVRALNINSQALDTDDFNNLEKFFTHDDKSLIQSLATLFANHSKYLTLPESIDAIFQALVKYNFNRVDSQIYLNILKEDARYEALSLLKLEFSNDVQEKLQTLSEIDNLPIRLVTLKSILKLLKNIELSTTCIQVLAHVADQLFTLLPNSKIDLGTSEIIYKYKDELKKEYLKLESVLTLDINMFVINQRHENLQKALSARFTNIHVTNTYLNEMSLLYKDYSDDVQFIDNVLLKNALNKAKYISEYNLFLEFINKYSIPSEEIAVTLDKNDLLDSINIFETNLLTRNLNQLYDQINQNDNLLYSIKQHCYQLKTSGWSLDSLQTILKKVTQDNTLSVDKILNSLIKYNIKEEERDKKGWCFLDIIQNNNSTDLLEDRELDRKIHDIFVNKFEYKLENKSTNLLNKISDLNPDFAQRYPDYQHTLNTMHRLYNNGLDDEKDPIKDWDKNKVHDWVTNLKSSLLKVNSPSEQSDLDINQNNPNSSDLAQIIAVLQRANNIHTTKDHKEGHLFRDAQIISLLLLIDKALEIDISSDDKGRLLQIATGEGKSAISAALAAALSLLGETVDIVTSSSVLAEVGYTNAKGFFNILGLSVGINIDKSTAIESDFYKYDIIYGDTLTFQSDFLSNSSNQGLKRGDRDFGVVILDEVDSMLIDGSNNLAKQSSSVPLMEFLLPVMTAAWNNFTKVTVSINVEYNDSIELAEKIINSLIEDMLIPKHLLSYAKYQVKNWAKSLVDAAWNWEENKHYVINVNKDGKRAINPVDNSTGVTQEHTVWQNGLHQFLQIKHNLHIESEGLTTFFISNISYFQKYTKILGMTGTLGSDNSQAFLKDVYDIDLTFIPTYKDKQVIELAPEIANTDSEHKNAIYDSAYTEAVTHNRAVLIICKNIQDVDAVCKGLNEKYHNELAIIKYSRSEERLYNVEIEQETQPHTIIVATSLAGRGTDIKTTHKVEENGGLHVISTFIAKNARDEAQIQGRTARQGNSGTYQYIILDRDYYNDNPFSNYANAVVNVAKLGRDANELHDIELLKKVKIPNITAQDKIYDKFSKYYIELIESSDAANEGAPKIKQLVEDFGLWLKTHKDTESVEDFITSAKHKYSTNTFTNPVYPITQHYGMDDPRSSITLLKSAIKIDDTYNLAAHYYTAKNWLDIGDDEDLDYKTNAIEELIDTANRVAELISYLTAMNISVADNISADNELLRQTTAKLTFFHNFAKSIQEAIDVISQCPSDKEVRVKRHITKQELSPSLDDDDITEIGFLGVNTIFEVETYKPPQEWLDTVIVGVCAIVQVALGVLIAIGTLGGRIDIASGLILEGLKDAYDVARSISKGESINLDDYLTSKAISYVLIGAQAGISKLSSTATVANKGVEEGTKQAVTKITESVVTTTTTSVTQNTVKNQLIKEMLKEAGVKLATTIAIEKVGEWASNEVRDNLLDGLESRISGTVSKTVITALDNNPILLTQDHNLERHQLMAAIKNEIFKATKIHKNSQILNQLASGLLKVASTTHGIGSALSAMHKVGSMVDAGTKIEPIMDDMKYKIADIINQAGAAAKERPKGKISKPLPSTDLRDSLAKNIGDMVASALLNQIQRKITTPLMTSAASYVVDEALKDYHQSQQNKIAKYSEMIQRTQQQQGRQLISGVNTGDEFIKNKELQDNFSDDDNGENLTNPNWYDKHGNLLPIEQRSKLVDVVKLEENREFNTMLRAIRDYQHEDKQVPIFDVSNKTTIIPKTNTGFSFGYMFNELLGIQSAHAAYPVAIAIGAEKAVVYGTGVLLGAMVSNKAVQDYNEYQASTNYSRYYTLNAPEGSYLPALTGNLMLSGLNTGLFANPVDQMKFDGIIPEVSAQTARNHIVANQGRTMPVMDTELSGLLKDVRMDIDPNANRPTILSTPIVYQPKSILFTPDDSSTLAKFGQLKGFTPSVNTDFALKGFDIHEQDWKDLVLYKDYEIDHWNVKPASVKEAPEVYQDGKFGKIYKDFEQTVGNKEIWWSKDTAKHGGASEGLTPSTYKLFIKTKTEFEWIGDADATGKVIENKHKSEVGKNIRIKDCWKVK